MFSWPLIRRDVLPRSPYPSCEMRSELVRHCSTATCKEKSEEKQQGQRGKKGIGKKEYDDHLPHGALKDRRDLTIKQWCCFPIPPFPSSSSVLHLFPLISAVPLETDCSSRQPLRLLVFSCCCQFIKSKISPLEFQLSGFKVSGSVAELVIKKAVCSRVRGHRGLSMSTGEKSGSAGEQHHDRLDSKPWGSI